MFVSLSNDDGRVAPHPKWTEVKSSDEVKCSSREFVRVPAAVALGSGHDAVERNRIDCFGDRSMV